MFCWPGTTHKMESFVRAHILVEGRVQGVGFRAFAHRNATAEGLSGWVQNLSDGRVEMEVQGPRERIESLLVTLKNGPSLAQVDQVNVKWLNSQTENEDFQIIYSS